MARAALVLILGLLAAGCVDSDGAEPSPAPSPDPEPRTLTYYLRADGTLNESFPAGGATPRKVPAAPTSNAYVNEDVQVFPAPPRPGLRVSSLELHVFYSVDRPTADPFCNGTDGTQTRHFVFWVGSAGIYPTFESLVGDPVLVPGRVYEAHLRLEVPMGGWIVPPGEPVQLLVAPLIANVGPENLHYLVEHASTPTRLELEATPSTLAEPDGLPYERRPYVIPANGGLFTGAGAALPHVVDHPMAVPPNASFVKAVVVWESTAVGKSDLDAVLLDTSGTPVASSTTPYRSEALRLFAPNLLGLPAGTYTLRIDAYSGVDTHLRVEWAVR